jgi:hypothetical protein
MKYLILETRCIEKLEIKIQLTEVEWGLLRCREACINECWDAMCNFVVARLGIEIRGNYNLIGTVCDGVRGILH